MLMVTPVFFTSSGRRPSHTLHPVLHVDRGQIERASQLEGDVDRAAAIIAAGGSHVAHAFHAVDGLLQQRGHRGLDSLGVGSGVEGVDRNLRRRQFRKLRDRKERNADRTRDHDEQRGNSRKDGTLDEEIGEQTRCPLLFVTEGGCPVLASLLGYGMVFRPACNAPA